MLTHDLAVVLFTGIFDELSQTSHFNYTAGTVACNFLMDHSFQYSAKSDEVKGYIIVYQHISGKRWYTTSDVKKAFDDAVSKSMLSWHLTTLGMLEITTVTVLQMGTTMKKRTEAVLWETLVA
ncbi:hypothetical protein HDU77_002804 [Chytriomyces hyalinus]|nr:hypothetical protein HDU77_002804 [Chytriomyces hyalinus]